jgi:monoamine oxidase
VRRFSKGILFALLLTGCRSGPAVTPLPAAVSPAPASASTPAAPPRVVVVGGGIAGLVSAYELARRGITTEILEASDDWGGRVATARYPDAGYGEYGMQEMWADNPLLGIARALKVPLDDRAEKAYSSVVIDGRLIPFVQPTSDAFFGSFLDARERAALRRWMQQAQGLRAQALAARPLTAALERLQSQSFGDWVATFGLPRRVAEWIRLTIECELATDWRSFSGLVGLVEFGFFLEPGLPNYHVQGGNARLVAALVDAIPGRKVLSATVTAIERRRTADGRTRVRVSYLRHEHFETVEAERVVVAVPFVRLHQIRFDPPLSDEKWRAITSLERGHYVVVHLLVDKGARPLWTVGTESALPVLTDGPLGVVYGVSHPSPPGEPLEVFSLLVHGDAAAAFHMVPREVKVRQILAALDKLWPGLSAHVRSSEVFGYHPAAIPVWPPGRSPLDGLARGLREPELGVYLAGDYTVSAHANGAAESAQSVAARISQELTSLTARVQAPPLAAPPRSPPGPRPADHPAP